jgi:serine protease Do
MKTKTLRFITTTAAAFIAAPVFALEAPADDAPPPPVASRINKRLPEIKLRNPQVKAREEAAFLGVIPGNMTAVLAEHLGLQPGEGIVVTSLSPNGPAAQAGITVNDVITHVADQPVNSQTGLTRCVVAHKPGEVVKITAIHKGKPATFEATLGLRPTEVADAEPQTLNTLDLGGLPEDLANQIRDSTAGNLGGINLDLKAAQGQLEDLQRQMASKIGNFKCGDGATVIMNDAAGSVELKSVNGSKEVTLRDSQNNVTWTGPWSTAEDKAAAPEEVSQRVKGLGLDKMTAGGSFHFNLGSLGQDEE